MKKKIFLLIGCSLMLLAARSQSVLRGKIADTVNQTALSNVSVSLLSAKDSFLYRFGRSDASGNFEIPLPDSGRYIVLMEYPGYADYVDTLTASGKTLELGKIGMLSKSHLLQEVVVTQRVASIRIKGDTTEYAADSFRVQPNANVEDLLKRLPGIQVDKDGKITAQGQTVKKVLVDGEEFFGDDPTLVTKNLRADMIDKVQVYDKKSDQAAFTGIDDGVRDKTINLKVKDDQKKGAFGKLIAGAGTNGYHESQAMVNKFKNKEKIGFYGIVANTGKAGLGWQDSQSYGDAGNINMDEDGMIYINSSNDDQIGWDGNFSGQGIPLSQSAGLHYDNKWKDGKYSGIGNYKFNKLEVSGNNQTISQNNLPGSIQYSNTNEDFKNRSIRNKVNGSFEVQLDSSSSLKIYTEGSWNHKNTLSDYTSETKREDSTELNNSARQRTNIGDNNNFNSNLLWRKKFSKKGRTLSFNMAEKYNTSDITGFLNSVNNYYDITGTLDSTSLINQYKTTDGRSLAVDTKLTYTEPLSKYSSLMANYGIVINNSQTEKLSFNQATGGAYTVLDSTYSNSFHFNQFMHRTGLNYIYNKNRFNFNIGSNVGFNKYDQKNLFDNTNLHRSFVNWYPQATIKYKIAGRNQLEFNYRGNTSQPSPTQIQPVATNDDPLNVYLGNDALKPSYSNNFSLYYNSYNVLSQTYLGFYSNFNTMHNAITTNTNTDYTTGKTIYQYVNVNGNRSGNAYVYFGSTLKKWDLRYGGSLEAYLSRNINFTNQERNISNSGSYSINARMGKYKENKIDVSISGGVSYNINKSSLQQSSNNNYWSYRIRPDFDFYLPLQFQVHTDMNYTIQQKTVAFNSNTNVALWNAWISKKFFKNNALEIRAAGNDLLNQNKGIQRNAYNNIISQNIYTSIRRYFLFSVIWNFKTGMGAGTSAK